MLEEVIKAWGTRKRGKSLGRMGVGMHPPRGLPPAVALLGPQPRTARGAPKVRPIGKAVATPPSAAAGSGIVTASMSLSGAMDGIVPLELPATRLRDMTIRDRLRRSPQAAAQERMTAKARPGIEVPLAGGMGLGAEAAAAAALPVTAVRAGAHPAGGPLPTDLALPARATPGAAAARLAAKGPQSWTEGAATAAALPAMGTSTKIRPAAEALLGGGPPAVIGHGAAKAAAGAGPRIRVGSRALPRAVLPAATRCQPASITPPPEVRGRRLWPTLGSQTAPLGGAPIRAAVALTLQGFRARTLHRSGPHRLAVAADVGEEGALGASLRPHSCPPMVSSQSRLAGSETSKGRVRQGVGVPSVVAALGVGTGLAEELFR